MSKDWVTFPAVAIRGTSLERARERERERADPKRC